ncbi:MAG: serine hydrolase [Patescibacteria group bacterium]|nr:serine hydrolase [Patescibacteria group bacterium]
MLNNYLFTISLVAQLTGVSLPQILIEDNFYFVPTIDKENEIVVEIEPTPKLPLKEPAPQRNGENLTPENVLAKAAIAVDRKSGEILWQKNQEEQMPIASITKLMTALVFLDHNPGWEHLHKMTNEENWLIGANMPAGEGEEVSTFDLFRTALVGSRNNAALALSHSTGISDENFKKLMNEKAKMLSMENTHFEEPTGLDEADVSTAQDLARLARAAFGHQTILKPMTQETHELKRSGSEDVYTVKNTNRLIKEPDTFVIAGKTGYTEEAGYCFLGLAENETGDQIVIAVLGMDTDWGRFEEAEKIAEWTFNNYQWEKN